METSNNEASQHTYDQIGGTRKILSGTYARRSRW